MPHAPRQRQPPQRTLASKHNEADLLELLAVINLADADDENDEDFSLWLLHIAGQIRIDADGHRSGRRGRYHKYNKMPDFFDMILFRSSSRVFKAWMRCVKLLFHIFKVLIGV
jgi:hypothetical protein